MPQIGKYKYKFRTEILCGALWGEYIYSGTTCWSSSMLSEIIIYIAHLQVLTFWLGQKMAFFCLIEVVMEKVWALNVIHF